MIRRLSDWLIRWNDQWERLNMQLHEARRLGFGDAEIEDLRHRAVHLGRWYPDKTPAQHAEIELRSMVRLREKSATWRSDTVDP